MKIKIDTKAKIIEVENLINLGQFIEKIQEIFQNNEWKRYKLNISK